MQSPAFEAVFNDDFTMRDDCPEEIAIFGGYRNGKSYIVMLITFLLCYYYPGVRWIFCRATANHLRDTAFAQFCDSFVFDGINHEKEQKMEIHFNNGSTIFFRAFDANRIKRILSSEYDGASICQAEEVKHELFLQLFGRLSGRALPKRLMLLEGNPDDTWPKKRYKGEQLPQGCLFLEAATNVNVKNVGEDYIERLEREFPIEFLERYVYGNWDKTSNRVFDEFNQAMHVIPPIDIKPHWKKFIGFDHGVTNPSAMVWMAIDEVGRIYIFDEWYRSRASIAEHKEAALRHGPLPMPADYSMKKIERDSGSVWADLQRGGLKLIEAKKDKTANILLVNQLFHQNRLFIFDTCKNVIEEHNNYRYEKPKLGMDKNRPEEVIKKDDHTCDAVMYAIRYIKDQKVIDPRAIDKTKTIAHLVESKNASTAVMFEG